MRNYMNPFLRLVRSMRSTTRDDALSNTAGPTPKSSTRTAVPSPLVQNRFGARSERELVGVHPMLVSVSRDALAMSTVDFGIFDGIRTLEEQREYVRTGVSKTLNSKHIVQPDGWGHAVDAVPYINGKYRWEAEPCLIVASAFKRAAEKNGCADKIRWGGCWRMLSQITDVRVAVDVYIDARRSQGRDAFVDMPHFELRP